MFKTQTIASHSPEHGTQWSRSRETVASWEDITDDHGEPESIGPGVWIVRAERDKPHHGIEYGDPIVLITETE